MKSCRILCALGLMIVLGFSSASAQGNISFTVTWGPVSEPSVTEILIYRSTTTNIADFSQIGSVDVSMTEYTDDSGLEPGVRYYYRLRSRNVLGSVSGFSEMVSARQINYDTPAEIQNECRVYAAALYTGSTWQVDWSTALPSTGQLEYWEMGSTDRSAGDPVTVPATSHSTMIGGLADDRIYFVQATAWDESMLNLTVSSIFTFATATGEPGPLDIVLDPPALDVPEGGTAEFEVSLSSVPSADVVISASRISGDQDIGVIAGGTLTFTPSNWFIPQTVVLEGAEDLDEDNGEAAIRLAGVSGDEVNDATLIATEGDNDTGDENNSELASAGVAIYPMPFQPASGPLTIGNLPDSGRIGIYDLRGQKVWDESWEGSNTLTWNGENSSGTSVASGRYFVVIQDGSGQVSEKRVILVVN